MSFNIIQNYLRKSFMVVLFVFSITLLCTPQISAAAAVEFFGATIDPRPLTPTSTDNIYLHIEVDRNITCLDITTNQISIDTINKKVNVSFFHSPANFTGCPFPGFFDIPIGNLANPGNYLFSIYLELPGSSSLFDSAFFIGDFNLNVMPGAGQASNTIPILPRWAILLMVLMLPLFASTIVYRKQDHKNM